MAPTLASYLPRAEYSKDELQELYPSHLKLEQVQVLFRHGERTPISVRLQNTGLPPYWNLCSTATQFRAAVLENSEAARYGLLPYRRQIETIGPNGEAVLTRGNDGGSDKICVFGELTDRGRETTIALGQRLRKLYVEQLEFLPEEWKNNDSVFLRATPVPRALESLQHVVTGFYPPQTRNLPTPPSITTRNVADENLYPNDHNCRRLLQLSRIFADLSAQKWNNSAEMAYIQSKIGKWVDGPVAVDGKPRLSGLQDHINSTIAHDKSVHLPYEFYDEGLRERMNTIVSEEWFRGYSLSSEMRRLAAGSVLGDIKDRMLNGAVGRSDSDSTKLKLALLGSHDSTIGALLSSVGAYDWKWPPFTSSVAFELFKSTTGPGADEIRAENAWGFSKWFGKKEKDTSGYYVRVRYNDVPVTLTGCKAAGKHLKGNESFCTLEAFKQIAERMAPKDWRTECRSNLDKTDVPPREEVEE